MGGGRRFVKGCCIQSFNVGSPNTRSTIMPEQRTLQRAREAKKKGKSPSVQAGEFVREEIHKIRRGQHGARSPEQAIAIGLSEARRAGVDLPPPPEDKVSRRTRKKAKYDYEVGQGRRRVTPRPKVARAVARVLKREGTEAASPQALARHARQAAARRTPGERSAAARKAVRTKGPRGRSVAARKAARTRARRGARTRAARTR
jgi:hypothetical protein